MTTTADQLWRRQRKVALILITLMGLVLIASTLWKKYFLSTNPASRIITVERLVEAGTWAHITPTDTTPFEPSIDVIKVGDNIYSSKPPNYPLLMAGESFAMKALTGWEFYAHRRDYVRMLTLVNQVLPYLLFLWVAFLFLRAYTQDSWTLYFMLCALGVGSLPFAYASTINNHTVSAIALFISFYGVHGVLRGQWSGWRVHLGIGLLMGFACSVELPAGAFAATFLGLLLRKDWRMGLWTLLGLLLPLIPTLVVFKIISGTWQPFYTQGKLYRFEGSYWQKPQGLDGLHENKLLYLFHITLGHKGLFALTPLLALGVWGMVTRFLSGRQGERLLWWAVALGTAALFLFVWLRTHNYGGDCIGMRWMIPAMPFLLWMAWPVVQDLGRSWKGRAVCIALLLLGLPPVSEALIHDAFIKGPWQEAWGELFR
jgi:hypothetical protein